jgi:L-fucose isomerase-like protein
LLQHSKITVVTVDLSEIIFSALNKATDGLVMQKVEEIKNYGKISADVPEEELIKQAKLLMVLENWIAENKCDAAAVQCWSSIQQNYGCASCLSMSMLGEKGIPCACERDVSGALTMLALNLASDSPSGYLDWNNNYTSDKDKCIVQHCSGFPSSFFGTEFEISNLDILGTTLGAENCFGACKGQPVPGNITYAKITTDDVTGNIRAYLGEGEITDDIPHSFGGIMIVKVNKLQILLNYMCMNGFEHHVAMNRSSSSQILMEALGKYLEWDIFLHE